MDFRPVALVVLAAASIAACAMPQQADDRPVVDTRTEMRAIAARFDLARQQRGMAGAIE